MKKMLIVCAVALAAIASRADCGCMNDPAAWERCANGGEPCACEEGCHCAEELKAELSAVKFENAELKKEVEDLKTELAYFKNRRELAKKTAQERARARRAAEAEEGARKAAKSGETLTGVQQVRENARKRAKKGGAK